MVYDFIKSDRAEAFAGFFCADAMPVKPALFGAWEGEEPAGVCLLDHANQGLLVINWIYTAEKFRKQGIASAMLANLKAWADRYDYSIYAAFEEEEKVNSLFSRAGFLLSRDSMSLYRVTVSEFDRALAPLMEKLPAKVPFSVVTLRELKTDRVQKLAKRMTNPADPLYMQLNMAMLADADMDLSTVILSEEEVRGLLLCRKGEKGACYITWLWNEADRNLAPGFMIRKTREQLRTGQGEVREICFAPVTGSLQAAAGKFFPGAQRTDTQMVEAFYH